MKKTISLLLLILTMSMISWGKENKSKPVLRFNHEGKFKIVQFTDIHLNDNKQKSDSVLALMKTVINEEKPDLVVLTGDIDSRSSINYKGNWSMIAQPMIDAKVPWVITFGNHDKRTEPNGEQIFDIISELPYYSQTSFSADKISGSGNSVLILRSSKSAKASALIYLFDSNSYFPERSITKYDWIQFDQISWYRGISEKRCKLNGGKPLPALGFFHIPLPEFKEVLNQKVIIGVCGETPCSSALNSGLYTSMLQENDVMGIFVGHDHNNNYIGCLHNIALAYGCKTGLECYGNLEIGARVIEMYEDERKFDTWIRSFDSQRRYFVTYPNSFVVEQK